LYYAANGGLGSDSSGITGADGSVALRINGALSDTLKQKYPHLNSATSLGLSDSDLALLSTKMSNQFAIAQLDSNGQLVRVTSLQMPGVLDALFAANAASSKLGVSFNSAGIPTFRIWAPTAKSVKLNLFENANAGLSAQKDLVKDAASGVWSYTAPDATWTNRFTTLIPSMSYHAGPAIRL